MIPTCWLLSGFFSPEICNPTDVWNPLLATTCLEQGVIRGNAITPFFLLLALLQRHADAVLACATAQEAEDCLRLLPWGVEAAEAGELLDTAAAMERLTPVSVLQCLKCVESQCASDLLPDAIPGTRAMWERRFEQFRAHMVLSRDDALLQDFSRFSGIEGYMDTYLLQKTSVYRVLARDMAYLPYPTICSLPGGGPPIF